MQVRVFKKQLILIGGGHANIQVLKKQCMNEYIGLHTILISEKYDAIYSGSTPAFLQGQVKKKDISIDLQRLCFNAGATFIKDRVVSLDAINQSVHLKNYPSLDYDLLSINTGSVSKETKIKIYNYANCVMVKPISSFVEQIEKIDQIIISNRNTKLTVIGSGIAGYEISFGLFERYKDKVSITLIGTNNLKEQNINPTSKKKLLNLAKNIGITLINETVKEIDSKTLLLSNGETIYSDINFLSTGSATPKWLVESSIKTNNEGFAEVTRHLQSINFDNIFITGDIANIKDTPRAKSGVMAVRQGEILKENIFLKFQDKKLLNHNPQKNWLYIINTFQKKALLNYYFLSTHGNWCWRLKIFIDKIFMRKFEFPNKIRMIKKIVNLNNYQKSVDNMICQGCGSKVSKATLLNYLNRENINSELSDSSILDVNSKSLLQSIDHIKLFSSMNPFDFGRISYYHSQNDILSSGGNVKSLSISLALPFCEGVVEEFYMEYFMKGVQLEASKEDSFIASGHSYQSNDPGITITMNGIYEKKISKDQAKLGDLIYLTKPLGTGYLLASYFKNCDLLSSSDFQKLMIWLKTGNKNAFKISKKYQTSVITDISGFGLASHLSDICRSSGLSAKIMLNEDILINKNIEILKKHQSSGFKNNYMACSNDISIRENHHLINILFDPQTNGPLLLSIGKNNQNKFEEEFCSMLGFYPILLGEFTNTESKLINVVDS